MWIWDDCETGIDELFSDKGWTQSQCVPDDSVSIADDLTYSGNTLTVSQAHLHSTNFVQGAHNGATFDTGANVALFAGGTTAFTKIYTRFYYCDNDPFTFAPFNIEGDYDLRNLKMVALQDSDSLYAGGGVGISYSYLDFAGLAVFDASWAQQWVPPDHLSRSYHWGGVGTINDGGDWKNEFGVGDWNVNTWYLLETQTEINTGGVSSFKAWRNGVLDINMTSTSFPFDVKGVGVGGFRARANNTQFRRFFDDIYVDKGWERVTITGASGIPEIQIPQTWADGSVTFTMNQASLVNAEEATLTLYKADGTTLTKSVTIGSNTPVPPTPSTSNSITGTATLSGNVTLE